MSMHPHATSADVSGDSKVWKPKILDVDLTEGSFDRMVELSTGKHRCSWVRQVEELAAPLSHFLEKIYEKLNMLHLRL